MLSRLFRRLFLEGLMAAFEAGELQFFADLERLNEAKTFAATLAPLRTTEWVVYAKKTFAGREQLLAYLARYTHRVAITNSRLLSVDATHVSFRWKNQGQRGDHKNKVMRITIAEFMRRFLLHVLPDGFHRIRHYGLLANGHRADQLALCRSLLAVCSAPSDCNDKDDNGRKFPSTTKRRRRALAAAGAWQLLKSSRGHSIGYIRPANPTACNEERWRDCATSYQRPTEPAKRTATRRRYPGRNSPRNFCPTDPTMSSSREGCLPKDRARLPLPWRHSTRSRCE